MTIEEQKESITIEKSFDYLEQLDTEFKYNLK
jgi:hypothetical protein